MNNGTLRVRPAFLKASILVCLALTPFITLAVWDYLESRRLAHLVEDIRGRGEPVTAAEWHPARRLSGEEADAARFYRAAAALSTPNYGPTNLARGSTESPVAAEAIAYIDRAAPLRFSSFDAGTTYSYLTSQLLVAERLVSARTRALAEHGKGDEAAASLYAQLRVSRAFAGIGAFMVLARDLDDLEAVLSGSRPGAGSLARLAQTLADLDRDNRLKDDLLHERAMLLDRGVREAYWFNRPMLLKVLNDRLEGMRALIERTSRPWPRPFDVPSGAAEPRANRGAMMREVDEQRMFMAANDTAKIRAARLAIAAAAYRSAYGSWPSTIAALVPEFIPAVPIDPYRGEPMKMMIDGDGSLVAYSVGLNNRDDRGRLSDRGGTVRPGLSRAMADGDIGIRIKVP